MPSGALIWLSELIVRVVWGVASLEQQKASLDRLEAIRKANLWADELERAKFGPRPT